MQLFVTLLHVLLSFFLILIILLQPGKEGAASLGGGGANQSYGPRGQAHALGRATAVVAVLFMFTSITLAYWSNQSIREGSDIDDDLIMQIEAEDPVDVAPQPEVVSPAPPTPVAPTPAPEDAAPEGVPDDGENTATDPTENP